MKTKARLLALGAGVSALAVTAHVGLAHQARGSVEAAIAAVPGLGHAAVTVDTLSGRVGIAGLRLATPDGGELRIAHVTLPTPYALIAPALAAGDVSFEGVSADFGGVTFSLPRVDISGTSNSREEIAAAFDLTSSKPLAERLATLSAASVSAPELTLDARMPEGSSRTVYKDIRVSGIANGVVKSMAASGGTLDSTGKDGQSAKGSYGPMSMTDVDLPLVAQVYFGGGTPGGEMRLAQGAASVESVAIGIKGKGGNVAMTMGRISARGLRMKPTGTPIVPVMQEFAGKPKSELTPQDNKRIMAAVVSLYQSIAIDGVEMTDLAVDGPTDSGHAKIGRVALTGAQVGKPNELRIEAIDVTGKDGYGRIGQIVHSGWSYEGTLAALREAAEAPGEIQDNVNPRALIPQIGTLSVRDVDFDVPDEKARAADPKAPNIRFGLKGFEFSATEPLQGMPTALRFSTDRLTLAIPPGDKKDGLKDLLAMGYKDLDLSSTFDARWTESSGDLSVNQVSFQGVNMGNVALRGVIGNVARDVFTGDATTAQIALLGATIKQTTLTIENKGLFERALEYQAKGARKSPDQLRKELAAAAQVGVPAMLGNGPSAKQIAQALTKFIAKPNRLTLTAKTRDPAGLGLADFGATGGDPRAILEALNVTATAD